MSTLEIIKDKLKEKGVLQGVYRPSCSRGKIELTSGQIKNH